MTLGAPSAMSAVATTKERWCEAEVYRMDGEIALLSSELDAAKAEGYFQRALAVARQFKKDHPFGRVLERPAECGDRSYDRHLRGLANLFARLLREVLN
jgi:hypothetical protein